MATASRAKQACVVEAVRRGYEGEEAVRFMQSSGYSVTSAGIVRQLRTMGGRGRVKALVEAGRSNEEILEECLSTGEVPPPGQGEMFDRGVLRDAPSDEALYPTTKISLTLPSDLYEAIKLAARAEKKSRNQLIVDLLTGSLSRMPAMVQREFEEG